MKKFFSLLLFTVIVVFSNAANINGLGTDDLSKLNTIFKSCNIDLNNYSIEGEENFSVYNFEGGYRIVKIFFYADCPDSWYNVSSVLSIKIWDDPAKPIELYHWFQDPGLVCS